MKEDIYRQYGIYGIKNIINGKIYIGKTMVNFGDRWDCHKAQLRGGYHSNPHLQHAWNKYKEDNFELLVIHNCIDKVTAEDVSALEKEYIKYYKKLNLSYNISDGGDDGFLLGSHLSEDAKRRIGEKNRINMLGRKASNETKRKMSISRKKYYKTWTSDDRIAWGKKVSKIRGYSWSDESKQKMKDNKNGAKYTVDDVREIRRLREIEHKSFKEIANIMNMNRQTVYLIATYRRWKNTI